MVSTAVSLLVIGYKVRITRSYPHPHTDRLTESLPSSPKVSIFDKLRLMKKREEDIETFFKSLSESQLKDAKVSQSR
jgi:hypothetical protein